MHRPVADVFLASVCSAILCVAHSLVILSGIQHVSKQEMMLKGVAVSKKGMKPWHYLKFVPVVDLPVSSHLSSSLLQVCVLFSAHVLCYFTEVTRHFHHRPLHREGQRKSADSRTPLNANCPLNTLQHSQHEKKKKLLPYFSEADTCEVVKKWIPIACCSPSLCEYITTMWVTAASALDIPSVASCAVPCSLLFLMPVLSLLTYTNNSERKSKTV